MSEEEMNNNRTLEKIFENLSNNMMFKLSLGSKELFHSNYWAHLLKTYPDTFKTIFYPEYKIEDTVDSNCVHREMEHTDISFMCKDGLIIIENKCKDQPKIEQIVNYILKNNPHKIILISFFQPSFNDDDIIKEIKKKNNAFEYVKDTYQHISYDDLSEKFNKIKNDTSKNTKLKDNVYFTEYCSMLENIVALKKALSLKDEKKYEDIIKEINAENSKLIAEQYNFLSFIKKITLKELGQKLRQDTNIIDSIYCDYSRGVIFVDLMQNCEKRHYKKYIDMGITDIGVTLTIDDSNHCLRHYVGIKQNDKLQNRNSIDEFLNNTQENQNINWFFYDCTGYKNQPSKFRGYDDCNDTNTGICWLFKYTKKDIYKLTYKDLNELVKSEFDEINEKGN